MAPIIENNYVGDGSTVLYSFTFPYISKEDIYVSVDGIPTTQYTLANATTIEFDVAPANGAAILIYRDTQVEDIDNVFYPGSAIRARDLNDNFTQTLYVLQEADAYTAEAVAIAEASKTQSQAAETKADAAVVTADAADAKADAATVTANAADAKAGTALVLADSASLKSDTAIATANNAISQVADLVPYDPVADVAAAEALIPTLDDRIEIQNSTGVESSSALFGVPAGFVGRVGLKTRFVYSTQWDWVGYVVEDPLGEFVLKTAPVIYTGANVSELVNDANYLAVGDNISDLNNNADYISTTEANLAYVPKDTAVGVDNIIDSGGILALQATESTTINPGQDIVLYADNDHAGTNFVKVRTENSVETSPGVFENLELNVSLDANSITADRVLTFPDKDGTIATTGDTVDNANTVGGLIPEQFIRSDITDNVFANTTWQDNFKVQAGSSGSLQMYHNGTNAYLDNNVGHLYLRANTSTGTGSNIYIQAQSGENSIVINDNSSVVLYHDNSACLATTSTDGTGSVQVYGSLIPDADNTGAVGTAARTWSNGQFTNLTIDSTLNVRGAIDLADSDVLRFGSGDDATMYCNGTHMYMDLQSGIGNFYIRDGTTTRFTFDDAGHFTATGNITANGTITGTLTNANVRTAIGSSSVGSLGTYAFLGTTTAYDNKAAGGTVAGTYLRYSNALADAASGTPSGSWRLMGKTSDGSTNYGERGTSLYLRYA